MADQKEEKLKIERKDDNDDLDNEVKSPKKSTGGKSPKKKR
jgi:hypothetical protein